jgi:hypothetical protein
METGASSSFGEKCRLAAAWVFLVLAFSYCAGTLVRIGLDLRNDLWTYARDGRVGGDIDSAMRSGSDVLRDAGRAAGNQRRAPSIARPGPGLFDSPMTPSNFLERWHRLWPIYGQLVHAWVHTYDQLQTTRTNGDYEMDYPPMRLLVMTLWTWKVQEHFPRLMNLPGNPRHVSDAVSGVRTILSDQIASPVLAFNTVCSGIAAIAAFFLVWVWVQRDRRPGWGDRLLFVPVAALGVATILRFWLNWKLANPHFALLTPIDQRATSLPWMLMLTLRVLSVVALARFLPHPFRGPACGLVAGTLFWLNPPLMLDSHVWPQWEAWIFPGFLLAALFASLDWWLAAGVAIGIGCMFKGQLLIAAPVLIFCPLLAGRWKQFIAVIIGLFTGMAIVVWPWMLENPAAQKYFLLTACAAILIGGVAFFQILIRRKLGAKWTWAIAVGVALLSVLVIQFSLLHSLSWAAALPLLACLILPFILPRAALRTWLIGIATCAIWLAAFALGGSFSWWNVGFAYGTVRHDEEMQLGGGDWSNLAAILQQRYGWNVHDPVGTISIPLRHSLITMNLDLRQLLGIICIAAISICSAGAAIQYRRKDARFLIAMVAPWAIFPVLLPQMSARYSIFPAAMSVLLIGVSTRWSLLCLLATWMGCVTIALRIWPHPPRIAPMTLQILQGTHPDMAWATLLMAAVLMVGSFATCQSKEETT